MLVFDENGTLDFHRKTEPPDAEKAEKTKTQTPHGGHGGIKLESHWRKAFPSTQRRSYRVMDLLA